MSMSTDEPAIAAPEFIISDSLAQCNRKRKGSHPKAAASKSPFRRKHRLGRNPVAIAVEKNVPESNCETDEDVDDSQVDG